MLTTKQAAEKLGLSASHVKHLCQDFVKGRPGIKAQKLGKTWIIQESELKKIIKRRG